MQVATCIIIYIPLSSLNSGGTWIEWGLLPGLGKFTDQRNQRDPGVAKETDRWFSSLCASSTFSSIVLGQWTHWLSKIKMCWLRAAKSTCWCFFWWPVHFVFTVVRPKNFTQPLYLLHLKSLLLVQRPGVQRRSAGLKPKFQNMVLGAGSCYYRSQNWMMMMHTFTEKNGKHSYFMVRTQESCKFSLQPTVWIMWIKTCKLLGMARDVRQKLPQARLRSIYSWSLWFWKQQKPWCTPVANSGL